MLKPGGAIGTIGAGRKQAETSAVLSSRTLDAIFSFAWFAAQFVENRAILLVNKHLSVSGKVLKHTKRSKLNNLGLCLLDRGLKVGEGLASGP